MTFRKLVRNSSAVELVKIFLCIHLLINQALAANLTAAGAASLADKEDKPTLRGNFISRVGQDFLIAFPALRYVSLHHNRISILEPNSFDGVDRHHLETISLSNNNLNGSVPTLFRALPSLKNLEMPYNPLSGVLNLSAVIPPSLKILNLQNCQISQVILGCQRSEDYCHFALEQLWLDFNRILELGPESLPRGLGTLGLESNGLVSLKPRTFSGMNNIAIVKLGDNQLETLTPEMVFVPLDLKARDASFLIEFNPFRCNCSLLWLSRYLQAGQPQSGCLDQYLPNRLPQFYTANDYNPTCRFELNGKMSSSQAAAATTAANSSLVVKLASVTDQKLCPTASAWPPSQYLMIIISLWNKFLNWFGIRQG